MRLITTRNEKGAVGRLFYVILPSLFVLDGQVVDQIDQLTQGADLA